jgi:hypothetical protein
MFKTLYRCPRTIARHENGPLNESRRSYLEHLAAEAFSSSHPSLWPPPANPPPMASTHESQSPCNRVLLRAGDLSCILSACHFSSRMTRNSSSVVCAVRVCLLAGG